MGAATILVMIDRLRIHSLTSLDPIHWLVCFVKWKSTKWSHDGRASVVIEVVMAAHSFSALCR